MKYVYKKHTAWFAQYAVRVWNMEDNFQNPEITAEKGSGALEHFLREAGLPTTLSEENADEGRLSFDNSPSRRDYTGHVWRVRH